MVVEWTNQHGCGTNPKTGCEIVIQYACEDTLDPAKRYRSDDGQHVGAPRDGTPRDANDAATDRIPVDGTSSKASTVETRRFGQHETIKFYSKCFYRSRNKGLYTSDQNVGSRGTNTRQNPNGNRRGLECPEERDYYPHWQASPWIDVAVITNNPERCPYYKAESSNIKPRGECVSQEKFYGNKVVVNRATCPGFFGRKEVSAQTPPPPPAPSRHRRRRRNSPVASSSSLWPSMAPECEAKGHVWAPVWWDNQHPKTTAARTAWKSRTQATVGGFRNEVVQMTPLSSKQGTGQMFFSSVISGAMSTCGKSHETGDTCGCPVGYAFKKAANQCVQDAFGSDCVPELDWGVGGTWPNVETPCGLATAVVSLGGTYVVPGEPQGAQWNGATVPCPKGFTQVTDPKECNTAGEFLKIRSRSTEIWRGSSIHSQPNTWRNLPPGCLVIPLGGMGEWVGQGGEDLIVFQQHPVPPEQRTNKFRYVCKTEARGGSSNTPEQKQTNSDMCLKDMGTAGLKICGARENEPCDTCAKAATQKMCNDDKYTNDIRLCCPESCATALIEKVQASTPREVKTKLGDVTEKTDLSGVNEPARQPSASRRLLQKSDGTGARRTGCWDSSSGCQPSECESVATFNGWPYKQYCAISCKQKQYCPPPPPAPPAYANCNEYCAGIKGGGLKCTAAWDDNGPERDRCAFDREQLRSCDYKFPSSNVVCKCEPASGGAHGWHWLGPP